MARYVYRNRHREGYYGAVYEFTGKSRDCDDEIRLVAASDEFFEDDGSAIAWAINH